MRERGQIDPITLALILVLVFSLILLVLLLSRPPA